MKLRKNQNSSLTIEKVTGKDKNGEIIYTTYDVVTTMNKVFVYRGRKLVGAAGCIRNEDFDFYTLFELAIRDSMKHIEVA